MQRLQRLHSGLYVSIVLGVALLLSGTLAWSAVSAGGTVEVRSSDSGIMEVRSLTPEGLPLWPVPASGTLQPRSGGTILWYDTNHLNAVAENVAITGDGACGIAGWWLNSKRVALYRINDDNVPEWTHSMVAQFQIPVAADLTGAEMPATGRGDPLYVFSSASSTPVYQDGYTAPLVGYHCAVSGNGNTYVGAGGNPDGTAGEVRVYDGSGTLRFIRPMPAPPEGVAISSDGLVVASNVRGFVKIWDAMTGALRDSVAIPGETQTPAVLSGDGTYLATGGFNRTVRLYQWNGTDYVQLWQYVIPSTTWITALAMADDGTLAAGTWTNGSVYSGIVLLFSTASATPLWSDSSFGDEVPSVAITPNGAFIAAASWGRYGGTVGNIISFYSSASSTPLFGVADDAIAGIGSCMSIDVSDDGAYVFAGGKAVHAREMGSGGWTMALQSSTEGVPDGSRFPSPRLAAWPNPSAGPVTIQLSGPGAAAPGSRWELVLSEVDGREIRREPVRASDLRWIWDGRDASGEQVGSGVVFARLRSQDGTIGPSMRLTVVR